MSRTKKIVIGARRRRPGGGHRGVRDLRADARTTPRAAAALPSDGEASALPDAGLTADTLEGTTPWTPSRSFVGYRVREKLASLPAPNEAVGRTSDVTGSLTVTGLDVNPVEVTADLTTLDER